MPGQLDPRVGAQRLNLRDDVGAIFFMLDAFCAVRDKVVQRLATTTSHSFCFPQAVAGEANCTEDATHVVAELETVQGQTAVLGLLCEPLDCVVDGCVESSLAFATRHHLGQLVHL